ncbi:MAG: Flp pilus assembly complex ATPase component TadA [Armatimonadetes bacterium]|nr:Flp pilus assembly complex ATPase component TadA [Armatimonadota bacterium]
MRKQLGEILVSRKVVTQVQLDEALEDQRRAPRPLGRILVQMGFVSEKLLLQALSAQKGVSCWHLDQDPPHPEAMARLSQDVCRDNAVIPVRITGDLLLLAMRNPDDIETIDLVRNVTGMRIEPFLADETKLKRCIEDMGLNTKEQAVGSVAVDNIVRQAMLNVREVEDVSRAEKAVLGEEDTRPVVSLVNQLITDAINRRASDIHIEPQDERIEIRLRIDGQLIQLREIPSKLGPMLTTRIKILAGLDIVESRVPQDGRITAELGNRVVDLRVSVLPGYFGSRIVLRILDKAVGLKRLDELGFDHVNFVNFKQLIERPYGLFLVTGPTGSGKTTTLYAALNEIKTGRNNVMTCEDPIEYLIDGVSQSQVNDKVGLTFASQLRAILRQDPDIVLVGEIRDQETAETAVRASITGHMVLSTLHTNDAPSAIPRLIDMGVDPLLLGSSLVGIMSQRLLRVLCNHCKEESLPTLEEANILDSFGAGDASTPVWRSIGCDQCAGSGFRGRMAVHELMPVTGEVAKMISDHRPIESIREVAPQYGYSAMQSSAVKLIVQGETSFAEARRLLSFDTIVRRDEAERLLRAAA